MPNRRSLKTDISFQEKISMGAIGTRFVFDNLRSQGHRPIELERGSMSYKVWKEIKIKRIRVPDIICLKCGKRFESRAKKRMEISMSHSTSDPNRGWDSGLEDRDFVALVRCEKSGDSPLEWKTFEPVQYVKVDDMREAYVSDEIYMRRPKGAREGFEARLEWPTATASSDGKISSISDNRLQFVRSSDNRKITLSLIRKLRIAAKDEIALEATVEEGEPVRKGQILASVVPVSDSVGCDNEITKHTYLHLLESPLLSDRYTAVKVLPYFWDQTVKEKLREKVDDEKDHIYVRLESAASLMRSNDSYGSNYMKKSIESEYLEERLETVIVLGEIENKKSREILTSVLLNKEQNLYIRAGAAWALGEVGKEDAVITLIKTFLDFDERIRQEAARALYKLTDDFYEVLLERFPKVKSEQRAGIAWAINKRNLASIDDLLTCMVDDDARQWVAYIIGSGKEDQYIEEIELLKNKDPEVYFAVTVLWKIMSSWTYGLEVY